MVQHGRVPVHGRHCEMRSFWRFALVCEIRLADWHDEQRYGAADLRCGGEVRCYQLVFREASGTAGEFGGEFCPARRSRVTTGAAETGRERDALVQDLCHTSGSSHKRPMIGKPQHLKLRRPQRGRIIHVFLTRDRLTREGTMRAVAPRTVFLPRKSVQRKWRIGASVSRMGQKSTRCPGNAERAHGRWPCARPHPSKLSRAVAARRERRVHPVPTGGCPGCAG